jgi:hypothetical protein
MHSIRTKLQAEGIGIKVKYDFDCNSFARAGSKATKNARNACEEVINDILFAQPQQRRGGRLEVAIGARCRRPNK